MSLLDRVLGDLPAGVRPRVERTPEHDDSDRVAVTLWGSIGGWGVFLPLRGRDSDRLTSVADQVQDWAVEELWSRGDRHMFASPLVREFWKDSAEARASLLVPGTDEYRFAEVATRVCDEYESVLSQSGRYRHGENPRANERWEPLDTDQVGEAA